MKVKEAMNHEVITISPYTLPLEAFEKMYKHGVRRLFVLDENDQALGVVSYTDLIGVLGTIKPGPQETEEITIAEIMVEDVITISANDGIEDAANLMLRADISGLLVMEDNKPVGVITKTDICRMVAAELLIPS
ncbi:CBS domain-containing protein [Methanobacterium alkalithermotolerans]|uniref:CBS domain-containing protein n=1 Tax=Methanobacterium alkalithermotolerans TaxID=2731220 RepID=A0A8T8K338_9EURY|nr:CBS domain-containing protein [Methanobacterium alkalithermotolerans]QUH22814.1 CBS domain-containing protein [Methanobacterium alkalithermotolerans]RJS49364.1 MAG: histidine kinase [Methanobacterium sp.]